MLKWRAEFWGKYDYASLSRYAVMFDRILCLKINLLQFHLENSPRATKQVRKPKPHETETLRCCGSVLTADFITAVLIPMSEQNIENSFYR
jgi:hypothetical protein